MHYAVDRRTEYACERTLGFSFQQTAEKHSAWRARELKQSSLLFIVNKCILNFEQ